ncbi:ComF family protein [Salipiger sp. IMCC34102]|uniref:double zinc ribbon domain-containing protein n=1 Tax=Salipiger sp. IMCC34102 TaxID=2510647 RepID=UPI00101C6FAD|nr:double zinc ribbon domain-containing protein [Salipiger sp. IMCC34102]RYH04186.1 ComF family protein [Salipiger sp. IMCC34102]
MNLQTAIRAIYPATCVGCAEPVADENGLCGACWSETHFIHGLVCDLCGAPLMGTEDGLGANQCDDCLAAPPPWDRGCAVLEYAGKGRAMVLGLKHNDRSDLAVPAAGWIAERLRGKVGADTLVVPIPLHWSRLVTRRYNQAALLGRLIARHLEVDYLPDALQRTHRHPKMENETRRARFQALSGAIRPHPRRGARMAGRAVLIVDDVMTSGATLTAAARAARRAGAGTISVAVLARVVKEP